MVGKGIKLKTCGALRLAQLPSNRQDAVLSRSPSAQPSSEFLEALTLSTNSGGM
jgi:hypothetical protein